MKPEQGNRGLSGLNLGLIISLSITIILAISGWFMAGQATAFLERIKVHEARITTSEMMMVQVKEKLASIDGNIAMVLHLLQNGREIEK